MLCFAKSRKARCVEGDPGKGIKRFMFLSILKLLTFLPLKDKSTSLHVALPFTHLNCCTFLLLAGRLPNFQSLEMTNNSITIIFIVSYLISCLNDVSYRYEKKRLKDVPKNSKDFPAVNWTFASNAKKFKEIAEVPVGIRGWYYVTIVTSVLKIYTKY